MLTQNLLNSQHPRSLVHHIPRQGTIETVDCPDPACDNNEARMLESGDGTALFGCTDTRCGHTWRGPVPEPEACGNGRCPKPLGHDEGCS